MTSVGTTLRSHREAQGRAVADIAQELCITQAYLRAIEADDLQSLPGIFFYKSFVRQYAALLDLPPDQWQPGVRALTVPLEEDPPPTANVSPDRNVPESRANWRSVIRVPDPILEAANKLDLSRRNVILPLAGLGVALLACSSFYSWWSRQDFSKPDEPVQVSRVGAEDRPQLDVTTSTGEDGLQHVVLNLSATEETWVSISSDGKQIFSGILEPSETKTLTGLEVARMKVGNAGGIDVNWNGQQIGPIGKSGQVRTVLLSPEGVEIVEPPPPPPATGNESL